MPKNIPMNNSSLTMIIKSSRKCNLRCSYCHDWRASSKEMDFEVLTRSIHYALSQKQFSVINFIWHGGEPLMLGPEYYIKALLIQRELRTENQYITNSIQTNGTLINKDWCDVFKKFRFNIGVSIDGPPDIHNLNRKYSNKKGSFSDVRNGIHLLHEYDIPFGVILVLNNRTLRLTPDDLFHFITYNLKASTFSILPARPSNILQEGHFQCSNDKYISNSEYCNFMKRIFDIWMEKDDPAIKNRELYGIFKLLLGGLPNVCTLSGGCFGSNFQIEPNGNIYHCDKFNGVEEYRLGNVQEDSLNTILKSEKFCGLKRKEEAELAKLSNCEWFNICHGGCPHDRFLAENLRNASNHCCGLEPLFEYVKRAVELAPQN